nr:hypothetical protein [uncultured Olsenella sp.]
MPNEIALVGGQQVETALTLQQRVAAVHEAYASVMQENVHYGVIPGTKKPSLLKPGAEMLCTQFRLVPSFSVTRSDLSGGHREYEVTCTLTKLDTGQVWAQGIGLCTTLESKYRYRKASDFEVTGDSVPKDYWGDKARYKRAGYGARKVNGVWEWVRYTSSERTENPDIADTYNTVLKMAKKRALVDATLTATGCSDMFTQDVEDFARPSAAQAQVEPAPADTCLVADLGPVRDRFKAWCAAIGKAPQDAMAVLLQEVKAQSMESMDAGQVAFACGLMDQQIAHGPQAEEPALEAEDIEF